jgi:flagellar protein FlaG
MNNDNVNMTNATQISRSAGGQSKTNGSNQQSLAKAVSVSAPVLTGSVEKAPAQSGLTAVSSATDGSLQESVSLINSAVKNIQRDLSFTIDDDSNRTVIKVLDSKSGNVIRQIPTEAALDIASQIRDYNQNAGTQNGLPKGILFSDIS